MLKNNSKIVTNNGRLVQVLDLPSLEFITKGDIFPRKRTGGTGADSSRRIIVRSSVPNEIYIDFGDESPIYTQAFSFELMINETIKTYTDGLEFHTIKISFKYPSKIKNFTSYQIEFEGSMPIGFYLYGLESLSISHSSLSGLISGEIKPFYITELDLHNSFKDRISFIPTWVTNSVIRYLKLTTSFRLSDLENSNMDKIINIRGLESLTFMNNDIVDVPSNFKDITTLKMLTIGGTQFLTEITDNIRSMTQLENLAIGYGLGSSNVSASFTSWGVGLQGMINLKALYFGGCPNLEVTFPKGAEELLNVTLLYFRGTYTTVNRVNSFIDNLYSKITTIATITSSTLKWRNKKLELCTITVGSISDKARPSGIYQQPQGFVLGESNGDPQTAMEKVWVLVKQYRWTILLDNSDYSGLDLYAP